MLGALLLSLSAPWVAGCSSGTTTPPDTTSQQQNQSEVSVSIGAQDIFAETVKQGRVSALAFSYADVASIRVDVAEQGVGGAVIFKNFDLFTSAGAWTGTLPFLPKGKALTFSARALNAAGTPLFEGSLDATLNLDHETVTIPLAPANNNAVIALPRIRRISIPSAFASAQSGNITFAVEATNGVLLRYAITSDVVGSGTFSPLNGLMAITLQNTAGAFVSQYTPPTVSTETVFSHTVTVTNAAGHSVSTTFTTKVKPNETSSGVIDTTVAVLFNPVINGLNGLRVRDTGNVIFTADVSDDGAQEALSYAWSFTPASGTTPDPVPAFTGTTNPSTLQNYTTAVQGDLKLSVKDGNNGTTTLTYKLTPEQFPDNPVAEGPLDGVNTLAGGFDHSCALFNNGSVRCWGYGAFGQLGYESTQNLGDNELPYTAGEVKILGKATKLAVGGNHSCALLDTGLVRCWGQNTYGQLGYNNTDAVGDGEPVASFGYVNLGGPAIRVSSGGDHTCAVMATGKVRCWGRNQYGQLGYGHKNNIGDDEQPWKAGDVDLGGAVATDISAGLMHTCALLSTGRLSCWGLNGSGQLGYTHLNDVGDNELPASQPPIDVGGPVSQVSVGSYATCALLQTGNIRCWGYNSYGMLGRGSDWSSVRLSQTTPVDLGGDKVLQVSTGRDHMCVLLATGAVKCWGYNGYGELGTGDTSNRSLPSGAVNLGGATAYQLFASKGFYNCALLSTGKARCWGQNNLGQLGYGNTSNVATPTQDIQLLPPTP
ncbi:RTX toxin [Corallococcus terminator]|uniref:RTX toxin n=2 Tax=Corallococcus terminator TaxID=2316733 RepID=A0A3A8IV63_9BACT|nr:RTX toxin [Corallococcus terminator]